MASPALEGVPVEELNRFRGNSLKRLHILGRGLAIATPHLEMLQIGYLA